MMHSIDICGFFSSEYKSAKKVSLDEFYRMFYSIIQLRRTMIFSIGVLGHRILIKCTRQNRRSSIANPRQIAKNRF